MHTEKGRIDIILNFRTEIAISVSDTGVGINLVDLKLFFSLLAR